jgi:anti-sigma regulatory factor (Ser/Thr protein kinase)
MSVSLVQPLDRMRNAPSVARRCVRDLLAGVGPPDDEPVDADLVTDAQLVVSELVTNAVLHGDGDIELRLGMADGALSVCVCDGGPAEPQQRGPGTTAEGGRGLVLVATLTQDWGFRPDGRGGKEVWALFTVRRPAGI